MTWIFAEDFEGCKDKAACNLDITSIIKPWGNNLMICGTGFAEDLYFTTPEQAQAAYEKIKVMLGGGSKAVKDKKVKDKPLNDCEIDPPYKNRIVKTLSYYDIYGLCDLLKMSLPHLKAMPNLGPKSIKAITDYLKREDLSFHPDPLFIDSIWEKVRGRK